MPAYIKKFFLITLWLLTASFALPSFAEDVTQPRLTKGEIYNKVEDHLKANPLKQDANCKDAVDVIATFFHKISPIGNLCNQCLGSKREQMAAKCETHRGEGWTLEQAVGLAIVYGMFDSAVCQSQCAI